LHCRGVVLAGAVAIKGALIVRGATEGHEPGYSLSHFYGGAYHIDGERIICQGGATDKHKDSRLFNPDGTGGGFLKTQQGDTVSGIVHDYVDLGSTEAPTLKVATYAVSAMNHLADPAQLPTGIQFYVPELCWADQ
jgi:hypothetical protein